MNDTRIACASQWINTSLMLLLFNSFPIQLHISTIRGGHPKHFLVSFHCLVVAFQSRIFLHKITSERPSETLSHKLLSFGGIFREPIDKTLSDINIRVGE